jgi:cytochrome c biogenesis protein
MPANPQRVTQKIYRQLTSIKLAIIIVILLGVVSLIAIFLEEYFPVNMMNWEKLYSQKMGLVKFEIFKFFGVFDPYHSFWFQILLFGLVLNIIFCTWDRTRGFLKIAFRPTFRDSATSLENLKNHATIKIAAEATETAATVQSILKKRRFKIFKNDTPHFYASKGGYSRIGFVLFHIGLIAGVLGGLVISRWGSTEYLWGRKGDILTPKDAHFSVRVDDFQIKTNEKGQVKDYLATLTVIENGQEVQQKVVEVNFPLRHGGYTFYQSSYREAPGDFSSFQLKLQRVAGDTLITAAFREKSEIPAWQCAITVLEFVPDFRVSGDTIYSASSEPRNPAIQVRVEEPGLEPTAHWIFKNFPDFHQRQEGNVKVQFVDLGSDSQIFTGLQVSRKPGTWLVWLGLAAMTLGLLLSFYIFHRRIWVVVEAETAGKTKIHLGGSINKNEFQFNQEFTEIVKSIKGIQKSI